MTGITMAAVIKIIIKSSLLTRRIFPNSKLNKLSVNPPEILISITPIARPEVKSTAIEESGGIFVDSLNLFTPTADKMATIYAVHSGYTPMNSPNDMPLKATCARASPNSECRFSTKKRPTMEQIIDIAIADTRALCIKPY